MSKGKRIKQMAMALKVELAHYIDSRIEQEVDRRLNNRPPIGFNNYGGGEEADGEGPIYGPWLAKPNR